MSDIPIPRLPKGFRDSIGGEVVARRRMLDTICGVYARFGFAPLETPGVEYLDVLGKYLPESDTPNAGVFAFRDDDSQWLSLRYDLTAPLARFVAEHSEIPTPFRRYQFGTVWRQEQKPGATRFREFYQCDFDTVGTASLVADAEVCAVLSAAMRALGISDDKFLIRVNNRKILNGVFDNLSISNDASRLTILRSIDKLDKVGLDGVCDLLGSGRTDPISGEFTKGAGLPSQHITAIINLLTKCDGSRGEACDAFEKVVFGSSTGMEGVAELREIDGFLTTMDLPSQLVSFDPSVVRGLEYYTGPVFEVELKIEVIDENDRRANFGSVAGGGRYDHLVERFIGRKVPATGASIGVDRLLSALQYLDELDENAAVGPVIVTVMDRDRINDYLMMVNEIRNSGISAELYLGDDTTLRKQLKYVDRRRSPIAIIAGSDEFSANTVQLKDMILGAKIAPQIRDNAEWRKAHPAMVVAHRSQLTIALQAMLARQKESG